jgi:hypothetical protein
MVVALLLWLILAVVTNRQQLKEKSDRPLLVTSLLFIAFHLFAPEKYLNSILFAQRWFPCAVILLLLALPAPTGSKRLWRTAVLLIIFTFSLVTTRHWRLYQQNELSGLAHSLTLLPAEQRVVGLDFIKSSAYLKGRPFMQLFAYAQALKGGDLNFSFAEHASGIVKYTTPRTQRWTPGLEWRAELVTRRDFQLFDYALINGDEAAHAGIAALPFMTDLTGDGRWRLYKIEHEG